MDHSQDEVAAGSNFTLDMKERLINPGMPPCWLERGFRYNAKGNGGSADETLLKEGQRPSTMANEVTEVNDIHHSAGGAGIG